MQPKFVVNPLRYKPFAKLGDAEIIRLPRRQKIRIVDPELPRLAEGIVIRLPIPQRRSTRGEIYSVMAEEIRRGNRR